MAAAFSAMTAAASSASSGPSTRGLTLATGGAGAGAASSLPSRGGVAMATPPGLKREETQTTEI